MIPGVVSSQCRVPQFAGGGSVTYDGAYTVRTFTSYTDDIGFLKGATPGSRFFDVQMLVVGGGGGGGAPTDRTGGGGGAGDVISRTVSLVPCDHLFSEATIGAGGRGNAYPSASGSYSNLYVHNYNDAGQKDIDHLASGGGRGGGMSALAETGGSGGGGYHNPADAGRAAVGDGMGNSGGNGYDSGVGGSVYRGGGGGGAAASGTTAAASTPGVGGNGWVSSITGPDLVVGAGGGGGAQINSGDQAFAAGGSSGVGGDGAVSSQTAQITAATSPNAYTGSGGGGGSRSSSGSNEGTNGASGVVILRYATNP